VPLETVSGGGGRFRLARIPAAVGGRLLVTRSGYRSLDAEAPAETRTDLELALEPVGEEEPWVIGIVLRAEGTPAKKAKVRLDDLATQTDADGRFELEKGWAQPAAPLVAALPGLQPALVPGAGAWMEQEFPPPPVHLVLGGPTLSIRGVVLDAAGQPRGGLQVGLFDGTVATPDQVPFELVEDLARGKKVETKSDRKGAFELEGLAARTYVLQVFDPKSLLLVRSDPVPAGTADLVLRLPADAFLPRVAGRVVARDGTPLEGVQVSVRMVTASAGGAFSWETGRSATTDAGGAFQLAGVPRRFATIGLTGDSIGASIIDEVVELDPQADLEHLTLSVARRCHFRVELDAALVASGGQLPDSISVLDAEDRHLAVYTIQGRGWSSSTLHHLNGLESHTLAVSEEARTLVLLQGTGELRRLPVDLVPGEVTVVRGDE